MIGFPKDDFEIAGGLASFQVTFVTKSPKFVSFLFHSFFVWIFVPNSFFSCGVLFQLDRLAPKANNTHTIVVRPMKFGYFNFTAAEVRYKDNEDSSVSVERVVFSSEPGQGVIIALRDYERQFSGHMVSPLTTVNYFLPWNMTRPFAHLFSVWLDRVWHPCSAYSFNTLLNVEWKQIKVRSPSEVEKRLKALWKTFKKPERSAQCLLVICHRRDAFCYFGLLKIW